MDLRDGLTAKEPKEPKDVVGRPEREVAPFSGGGDGGREASDAMLGYVRDDCSCPGAQLCFGSAARDKSCFAPGSIKLSNRLPGANHMRHLAVAVVFGLPAQPTPSFDDERSSVGCSWVWEELPGSAWMDPVGVEV